LLANDTNRVRGAVLGLLQDRACPDFFENFRKNNLKEDLSNDITLNPPLFSLVNTFKSKSMSGYANSHGYHTHLKSKKIRVLPFLTHLDVAITWISKRIRNQESIPPGWESIPGLLKRLWPETAAAFLSFCLGV
jgi:hypothetical protein